MDIGSQMTFVGPEGIGDAELIGLVMGVGRTGSEVLARFGSLGALAAAPVDEVASVRGVGRARAVRLFAALALGRRSLRIADTGGSPVRNAEEASRWFLGPFSGLEHEELHGLYLDRRQRPIAYRRLTSGSDSHTIVDPRQILRVGLSVRASGVIVAHNHPSGDPEPSLEDIRATRRLRDAGDAVGIALVDHLVIGGGQWRRAEG